jgi:hypothetical protein
MGLLVEESPLRISFQIIIIIINRPSNTRSMVSDENVVLVTAVRPVPEISMQWPYRSSS